MTLNPFLVSLNADLAPLPLSPNVDYLLPHVLYSLADPSGRNPEFLFDLE